MKEHKPKKLPKVGLVMKSLEAEFFKAMKKGAESYVAERADLELISVGTSSQTEIDLQITLIEQLIAQKVDAIVVIPIDSKALVPVVVKAIKQGIYMINIDIMLDQELLKKEGVELGFVGPDNEIGARMVADVLANETGSNSDVVIIEGVPAAMNAIQRKNGFLQSIEENGLNLLASKTANWETDQARQVMLEMLDLHPSIQGVLCSNDAMALGAIEVLKEKRLEGKIKVVGFDNDNYSRELLDKGYLLATIDAFGSQMAANGIDYAMRALNGERISGWIKTRMELVQ